MIYKIFLEKFVVHTKEVIAMANQYFKTDVCNKLFNMLSCCCISSSYIIVFDMAEDRY